MTLLLRDYTSVSQSSQGGGHRTLLYGHAILLKHTHSSMVSTFTIKDVTTAALCCPLLLSTSHNLLCSKLFGAHVISRDELVLPLFMLQYLSCLTTSRSLTDKLAFDVGLQEDSTGGYALHCLLSPHTRRCSFLYYKPICRHRRGLLVDYPSSLQAKVRRREGQGGR